MKKPYQGQVVSEGSTDVLRKMRYLRDQEYAIIATFPQTESNLNP